VLEVKKKIGNMVLPSAPRGVVGRGRSDPNILANSFVLPDESQVQVAAPFRQAPQAAQSYRGPVEGPVEVRVMAVLE
jgi:hypothetical protein